MPLLPFLLVSVWEAEKNKGNIGSPCNLCSNQMVLKLKNLWELLLLGLGFWTYFGDLDSFKSLMKATAPVFKNNAHISDASNILHMIQGLCRTHQFIPGPWIKNFPCVHRRTRGGWGWKQRDPNSCQIQFWHPSPSQTQPEFLRISGTGKIEREKSSHGRMFH